MVWGIFSFSGVGSLLPIEGMMNLYKYTDVIERKSIPDMRGSGDFLMEENFNSMLSHVFI